MTASRASGAAFEIGGHVVQPGERLRFDLPAALLPTHTQLHIPLTVLNGLSSGPVLWLSAAVHGDELNGVEVISRVLDRLERPLRRGTIVAAPIVNVFGFIGQSRYFPDRRDLNRSFPGSRSGSLASRIAHLFMQEVVSKCTHGIDLHTASLERANLPQVRGDLQDAETNRIARAFGAPVMLQAATRPGSLRVAAQKLGIPVLVYEGGEASRFNEHAIRIGVRGVLAVVRELGMASGLPRPKREARSVLLGDSTWVRARRGGLLRLSVELGDEVQAKQVLGTVSDPFGDERVVVRAPFDGVVIGMAMNPVVHGGDAAVHLGSLRRNAGSDGR